MTETPPDDFVKLVRSFGVQVEYVATDGKTRPASAESLLAVLRALGADFTDVADAPRALRERELATWRRRSEPVVVAWDDVPASADLRLPASMAGSKVRCRLATEPGAVHEWTTPAARTGGGEAGGERFSTHRVALPGPLPPGYHRLSVAFEDGQTAEALVIAAPRKVYQGPGGTGKRPWGVFCPLHALHGARSRGAGDFADLEALIDWTAGLGGGLVATLPMLASHFDGPSPVVSPYSPTSRLFWNEFYLDLDRLPELARSEAARALLHSEESGREFEELRSSGLVDYGRQMRLKRAVLERLAADFFAAESDRMPAFRAYLAEHPEVESYAQFQATGERLGRDWRSWPTSVDRSDHDIRAYHYHLYAQWQAEEQLGSLAAKAREKGLSWYLDFPVGVDFNSFDVWSHPDAFATGASVGCPPDSVFTNGQNWGFPPLHPERQREQGYKYLIASFRNHFRYANALRIDHVMGLHRLFWIPAGAEAKHGAFVSTPAEEIYAILSVESHRQSAWLVGEDLGTVPPEVAGALGDHGVRGMYVIQYEIHPDTAEPLRAVPEATVASVNTHDMPPFAAFWGGIDLDDRKELGLLDAGSLVLEREAREGQRRALVGFLRSEGMLAGSADDAGSVLQAASDWLAASPASVLLLNLEDLWLETEPQNTPNTYLERPNWRRKLRRTFEGFANDPALLAALKKVDELRSGPARPHPPARSKPDPARPDPGATPVRP